MLQVTTPGPLQSPTLRADGAAFLTLSLFCGLAGGVIGAFPNDAGAFGSLAHGLLLDLFVLIPAFLGGMGRLALPGELSRAPREMVGLDRLAFLMILAGAVLTFAGLRLPSLYIGTFFLWGVGVAALALSTIVKCLECRTQRFRELSPFAWSQLLASLGLIVTVPVMMAGLVHGLVSGQSVVFLSRIWLEKLQIPLLAIVVQLAFGAIANLVSFHSSSLKITVPLLLSVPALIVPVVWVHEVIVSASMSLWLPVMGVALPSFGLAGLICKTLWSHRFTLTQGLAWSIPALLLLSAGWVLGLFPVSPEPFHATMLFGAIFALFGCYYRWQEQFTAIAAPGWLGRLHLVSMGLSVLSVLPMFPVLKHCGETGMLVALLCTMILGSRLIIPARLSVTARSA